MCIDLTHKLYKGCCPEKHDIVYEKCVMAVDCGHISGWKIYHNAEQSETSLSTDVLSLEKEMATHSSIPAWEIPWTEEAGELQSMGVARVRHNLAN